MCIRFILSLLICGLIFADGYSVSSDKYGNLSVKINSKELRGLHVKSSNDLSGLYFGTYSINNKPIEIKPRQYLAGTVRIGKTISPVAIIVDRGSYLIDIGKISNSRIYRTITLENGKVKVVKSFKSAAQSCGNSDLHTNSSVISSNTISNNISAKASGRIVKLSVDADANWNQTYGTNSLNKIADIVHSANVIYLNQLQIKISLTRANVSTTNYFNGTGDVNEAGSRLSNYADYVVSQNYYNNIADVFHLFTTRDLTGYTVGIAYLGQICRYYPFGVIQDLSSLTPTIFAHELGHNFDARHDSAGFCGEDDSIMQPALGYPVPTIFSSCSKNAINTYLASNGSCLSATEITDPTPTPVPTPGNPNNPSATPTPNIPGGGSPDEPEEDVDDPELSIGYRQLASKISFVISNLNYVTKTCSYKVFVREIKTGKYLSAVILSGSLLNKNRNITATLPARYKVAANNYKLGIGLSLKCDGITYTSSTYKIDTLKAKSKSTLKFSPWIVKLKKTLVVK